MRSRGGRRGLATTVASSGAALALVVGLAACTEPPTAPAVVGADAPTTSSTGSLAQQNAADASLQREQEITAVLRERAAAIVAGDRAGFLASLDSLSTPFGVRQVGTFSSMSRLPFATFDYGVPEPAPALSAARVAELGPDATVVRLDATYTLAGFDRSPRHFETYLTLVNRDGRWRFTDDADGGTQPQLWDLTGLRVVSSPTTLVAGNVPEETLREYLALGDAAVEDVDRAWSQDWGDRLVLVAPATTEQMAAQLLQDEGSVVQVAAVTDGAADVDGRTGADRVVLNPEAFGRLRPDGRQVVVSHETTHVAIRRTTTAPVPIWLSEGFADYVGYGAVGVSRSAVAGQLLSRVRSGQGPTELPDAAAFDPGQSTIAPNYNAAYLAVSRLVDVHGQAAVVRMYASAATRREPSAGPEGQLASALQSELGTTVEQVTDDWLDYLDQLAG